MIKYKCGHKTNGVIILDDNELSISAYLEWIDSVGLNGNRSKCWDCYTEDMEDEEDVGLSK